jgi:hypothetical protein
MSGRSANSNWIFHIFASPIPSLIRRVLLVGNTEIKPHLPLTWTVCRKFTPVTSEINSSKTGETSLYQTQILKVKSMHVFNHIEKRQSSADMTKAKLLLHYFTLINVFVSHHNSTVCRKSSCHHIEHIWEMDCLVSSE